MKPRHQIYLDERLTEALDRLGGRSGTSKSAIVADALRAFLERRAAGELDELLKIRLDRVSRALNRVERNQKILMESLALFVRYQLTITAPLPEADRAGQALGRERFQRFVDQVGRQLASGRATFADPDEAAS
ncbi:MULTISPECIES: CopG family transcriptional regulator [unclassified Caulobacter]|uniref:ribbon-helix-helix domain-containing protein n=1 Tax=unclassified Caulobacter TaxID=2648921 RepID=UPI000781622D|nr:MULTISPECIES: CopG family transcriptional regulator [unclassified Caulobacter]AZS19917.1 ribbon-helix-helix protein, CopG family [Caulobacter sp. FWC26]